MRILLNLCLICFFSLFQIADLMAGPGGKIAKSLSDTTAGKVIVVVLFIVLFPFVVYKFMADTLRYKRTSADLKKLGMHDRQFEWLTLKNRITNVFTRVHRAWEKKDLADVSDFMTDWYWQNQQIVHLDKWEEQGLVNVCEVREISSIKPIYIQKTNLAKSEGSRVVVSIDANMEDYLARKSDGKVMEGIKGFKDRTTVWTFIMEDGQWKVENIEAQTQLSSYLKMKNQVAVQPVGQMA